MSKRKLGEFTVSPDFTARFCRLSGDFNPLHFDEVLARRFQFGSTVIHGVCGTLKALEMLLASDARAQSIKQIKVVYSKPVRHGDRVEIFLTSLDAGSLRLELLSNGMRAQKINLELINPKDASIRLEEQSIAQSALPPSPIELSFHEAVGKKGSVPLLWAPDLLHELFPNVKQYLPGYQTSVLLGTTNLVGMHCPGLDSVFCSLKLAFTQSPDVFEQSLSFEVKHSDERFSQVLMSVDHSAVTGEVEALFRAKPVTQSSYAEIKALVDSDCFARQTALVIGGSRGLGEITAKALAAGGAQVIVTYSAGRADAERVVEEIQALGGRCQSLHYDVLASTDNELTLPIAPTWSHVYYFASPKIEKGRGPLWDSSLFAVFSDYFLTGMSNLLSNLVCKPEYRKGVLKLFVPSTIYLDETPDGFSEYVAAKAAAEVYAHNLVNKYTLWSVETPRLPKMLTDQTSTTENKASIGAAKYLCELLVRLYGDKKSESCDG
jgi:acyl dehydratase